MNKKTITSIYAYSTIGLQLAIILVISVYGGYRLDLWLDTSPVFVLVGSCFGMGAGLYNLLKGLKEIDKFLSEEKQQKKEERKKWLK